MESEAIYKGKENVNASPTSPSFLKPKPLNLKRKPRRILSTPPLKEISLNTKKNVNAGCLITSPRKPVNPFRCFDNKRKRDNENEDSSNSLLCQWMSKISKPQAEVAPARTIIPAVLDEDAHFGFTNENSLHNSLESADQKLPEKPKHTIIPVDWSLKTKIRLSSSKPFPWRSSFKTSEEASGTTGFVRCLHSNENKRNSLDSSHGAKFYQQCLVWVHPYLPWLELFPRSTSHTFKNVSLPPLDVKIQESLQAKWSDSFRSLFQLVRTYQCPYFYLCAPTFTVLFRSSGVSSILDLHALICPTSKGFRKSLKEEGIEFTMPLCESKDLESSLDDSPMLGSQEYHEDADGISPEVDENANEDEEPEVWLEKLGLSQEDFPSLNKTKPLSQEKKIDHKPESLVYVEGSQIPALVNFLLNSPMCMSKIGPLAGIPPTLLSPTAFLGATLHSHKIHHGKMKVGNKELDSVELNGPLLPNTIHSLCNLFSATQDGTFSAVLSNHSPTLAFSKMHSSSASVPPIFATENLKDCGLPQSFIKHMCSKSELDIISTINSEKGFFTWT